MPTHNHRIASSGLQPPQNTSDPDQLRRFLDSLMAEINTIKASIPATATEDTAQATIVDADGISADKAGHVSLWGRPKLYIGGKLVNVGARVKVGEVTVAATGGNTTTINNTGDIVTNNYSTTISGTIYCTLATT